jgi:hypothetical protein
MVTPIQISTEVTDNVPAPLRDPEAAVKACGCEGNRWTSAAVRFSRNLIAATTIPSVERSPARKSRQGEDERRVVDGGMARESDRTAPINGKTRNWRGVWDEFATGRGSHEG